MIETIRNVLKLKQDRENKAICNLFCAFEEMYSVAPQVCGNTAVN
jgi:hypothetical protein